MTQNKNYTNNRRNKNLRTQNFHTRNVSKMVVALIHVLFFSSSILAQQTQSLQIGDKIPDLQIHNTLGKPLTVTSIEEIDKPLILDFFGTSCSSCIGFLPHLNKLQNVYGDKMKIIVVTSESRERIQKFLMTNPVAKKIDLTFIVEDTALRNKFPYHTVPHEVWVGKDLVVKAITGYEYITKRNINDFIFDRQIDLPIKDDNLKFDKYKPLDSYALKDRLYFKSCLIGFIDNANSNYHNSILLKNNSIKKTFYINFSPLPLINEIFDRKYTRNRILLEVHDSSRFVHLDPGNVSWRANNTYCYSISLPSSTPDSIRLQKTLSDLGLHLGVKIYVEKRNVNCYELVSYGKAKISPNSTGGTPKSNFYPRNGGPAIMKNEPLSLLVKVLNYRSDSSHHIIINGIADKNVDLTIPVDDLADTDAVDKALHIYGMQLRKTHKALNMVIISDK